MSVMRRTMDDEREGIEGNVVALFVDVSGRGHLNRSYPVVNN